MSNRSRIACSLGPAKVHHRRSKARISSSLSESPAVAGARLGSAEAASIPASLRRSTPLSFTSGPARRRYGSGVEAAGAMGLGHPADADHLSRGTQRHAPLGGQLRHLGVGPFHELAQPDIDLVLGPEVRLQVLYPLEIG